MMLNVDSGYDLKAYQFAPNVLLAKICGWGISIF